MRKYAIVSNQVVQSIVTVEDEAASELVRTNEMVIDIEDQIPQPEVGWVLSGNALLAPIQNMSNDQLDAYQQKAQRLFGLKILPAAVDKIGARNLKLSREGTPADVATLASQMASIKVLLEGGALKTVRSICGAIKPMHPNHADVLDEVIAEITNFLQQNGWN